MPSIDPLSLGLIFSILAFVVSLYNKSYGFALINLGIIAVNVALHVVS